VTSRCWWNGDRFNSSRRGRFDHAERLNRSAQFERGQHVRRLSNLSDIFILVAVALSSVLLPAQQDQSREKPPCVAAGEPIYRPGENGVKPPQPLLPDKSAKSAPAVRGPLSVELLVNSDGHVCGVRVLSAKDPSAARAFTEYISEHWTFKPATRQGKPVAVKFRLNWNLD